MTRLDPIPLLALGVALVFLAVVAAMRVNDTALWADEAWSLAATNDLGMSLSSTHGTMSAYYVPLWFWAKISDSTVWLRLLSTVFAAGTIVVTQQIARRVGGRTLAIVAPLVLVTSPMFLFTATEARGYALETLLAAICWYATLRVCHGYAKRSERRRWQIVVAVAAALGPLAHGLFLAQLVAIGAYVLLFDDRRRRLRLVAPALLAGLVVTITLWQLGLSTAGSVFDLDTGQILRSLRSWYVSPVAWVGTGVVTIVVAAVTVAVARPDRHGSVRAEWRTRLDPLVLPLCWVLVPLAVLVFVKLVHTIWAPYYLSPITPGVALVVAASLVILGRILVPLRAVVPSIALIVVVTLAWSTIDRPMRPVEDWSGAAQLIASNARPGDGILFSGGFNDNPTESRAPFEAAWRTMRPSAVPDAVSPARPLGKTQRVDDYLTPSAARTASLDHRRVWIIDYRDVMEAAKLTDAPQFDLAFRLISRLEFRGGITVSLYERREPSEVRTK